MKKALITGIAGQDGSYLAEFLLDKGYDVSGLIAESTSTDLIEPIKDKFTLIIGNLLNERSIGNAINQSMPDEVYHLASRSFVGESWKQPVLTGDVNALGTTRLLESIRKIKPDTKVYHASTSEMFGLTSEIKTENSPFHPKSPYAISKCFSHWISVNYRESHNMFICCGILFNHESPRRGKSFVTKKIARSVAEIQKGNLDCLYLGNIDSKRDWGYAKEYVEAMWLMLQRNKPDDYIISTGELHSVRDFLVEAFHFVGIEVESNGKTGAEEEYIRKDNGKVVVKISDEFFRPVELEVLQGSNSKAKKKLNWEPKVKFKDLVRIMVEYELSQLK
jgi:GDPmannose 4,6-dehydratase